MRFWSRNSYIKSVNIPILEMLAEVNQKNKRVKLEMLGVIFCENVNLEVTRLLKNCNLKPHLNAEHN